MIAYIDTYRGQFELELICRTLAARKGGFITSRGYRAAKARPDSARQVRDRELIEVMKDLHERNYGVYGVHKMWHAMRRAGWVIGRDQVARLMRVAGISGVIRGRKPRTTTPGTAPQWRPDLVMRDFKAPAPNRLWVGRYHLRAYLLRIRLHRVCYRCLLSPNCRVGNEIIDEDRGAVLRGS